jgi:hypothetical protein
MIRALLLTLLATGALAAGAAEPCALTPKEHALAALLIAKPAQLRAKLDCDPQLVALARERAQDMAKRGYFKHHTPEGVGPNDFLRSRGFPLPHAYPTGRGNTVEAIVGGYGSPQEVWTELVGSAQHRAHVLGEDATFLAQDRYGIGYAREWNTPQVDFWVVLIARYPDPGEPASVCSPPPTECVTMPKLKFAPDKKRKAPKG